MNELAVWFLAIGTIVAILWLVASSSTSWWLAFVAEFAVLAGAISAIVADLLAAWWSGWTIVAELAVITGAVSTSEALTDTATTHWWASWGLAVVAELAVLAGAIGAIVAHLLTSWWSGWTIITIFTGWAIVAELAVFAGAVLAIVADLLGAETATEAGTTFAAEATSTITAAITSAASWLFITTLWIWVWAV
jgi:hypothetical protein